MLLVCSLTLVANRAWSERSDTADADGLFHEGRALMKKGEYEAACSKLEASYRLDPAAGTGINLGDCFERLGKVASALLAYQAARKLLVSGDPRIGPVEREITALDARAPRLTLRLKAGAPPGTHVRRDGRKVPSNHFGVAVPVNPGKHVVLVGAPDHDERRFAFSLNERDVRVLEVAPGDPSADADTSRPDGPRPESGPSEGEPRFVLAGSTAVMLPLGNLEEDVPLSDSVAYVAPIEVSGGLWLSRRFAAGLLAHYGALGTSDEACADLAPQSALTSECSVSGFHLRAGAWGELRLAGGSDGSAVPWVGMGLGWERLQLAASAGTWKATFKFDGAPELSARFGVDWHVASRARGGVLIGASVASYGSVDSNSSPLDGRPTASHQWLWVAIRGAHDL